MFRDPIIGCLAVFLFAVSANAEKVLRVGLSAPPPSKGNPYVTTGTTANFFWTSIYDSLTNINNQGEVVPWLAIDWWSESETRWVFKLRPGVRFSNGEPFDAESVGALIERLKSDESRGVTWAREVKDQYAAVRVIDDLTVEIETTRPMLEFPAYSAGLYMAPRLHLEKVGLDGLVDSPIGTGPFVLEDWQPSKVLLSANRGSWRAPKVDRLEVLLVPEASARVQALESGQIDIATAISTDYIDSLKSTGHSTHMRVPTRILVLALLSTSEDSPFADLRVRQAVNYGVNRQAITRVLLAGLVEPASQPATRNAVGYNPDLKPYPYDPEKARQLLREAGLADGFSFTIETPTGFQPNDVAILQQITADLARINVRMTVRRIQYPKLIEYVVRGGWQGHAITMDFNNRYMDGLRGVSRYNHSCNGLAPWFCDPEIQPLIDTAVSSFDAERRAEMTRRIIRYYRDRAQSLFMFPVVGLDGISSRVTNWEPWNDHFMFHLADVED